MIFKRFLKKKELKGGWPALHKLPKVETLIDIGIGHQGTEGLYKYFPNSRKVFVDPLEECKEAVQHHLLDSKNIFHTFALGRKHSEVEIFVRHPISRSGIVEKVTPEDFVEKRKIEMYTLDEVIGLESIKNSVGIKIDAEGYELEIIKGAKKTLEIADFIILELPISEPRFKNSYSFYEALTFMHEKSFGVSSIRVSGDGSDHCDVAFIKNK